MSRFAKLVNAKFRKEQEKASADADAMASVIPETLNHNPPTQVDLNKGQVTMGTQSTHSTKSTESTNRGKTIAPSRDFMKVPNSITRQAVPDGMFKGKSKQIYDFLYSKTRGAIVPKMSIRLTRKEIMDGSNVGSTKTLYENVRHLCSVGLVSLKEIIGPHGGNEYWVHLPEEIITQSTQSSMGTQSTHTDSSQKQLGVLDVENTQSTQSISHDISTTCEQPKTIIKTNTIDDEAFARFIRVIQETTREVTGKESSNSETERWRELAELLSTELKIAAARTNVSSVPAFLTEHLRRRLWKVDKKQISREEKPINNTDKQSFTPEQIRHCPDCGGSGMYYPEGFEKGVARCRHERLKLEEHPTPKA